MDDIGALTNLEEYICHILWAVILVKGEFKLVVKKIQYGTLSISST